MKKYCKPVADITKLEPLHVLSVSLNDNVTHDDSAAKGSAEWADEDFDSGGFDW